MATARRSPTNENVQTYGNGTRDFTSLSTWEAATDIDLVGAAQSEVLEGFDDAASFDDTINMAGATTNSSFFRVLRSASGEGHDGTTATGLYFSATNNGTTFRLDEGFASLQDFRMTLTNNSSTSFRSILLDDPFSDQFVVGILIFDSINNGSGSNFGFQLDTDTTHQVILCLADNIESHGFRPRGGSGTQTFYNCVAIDCGSRGFDANGSGIVAKNCLADGNVTDFGGNEPFDAASVTNASGDATAPGTGSRINQTFTFVNAAAGDFHLADGDAGAKDFGTVLDADAVYAFDDDINDGLMGAAKPGEPFITWDIGFDEPNPVALITSDAVVNFESLVGLTKDEVLNEESLEGILTDRGPSVESEGRLTKDEGPNLEALVGLTKDEIANFESLIGITKDEGPSEEALQTVTEDDAPNVEAGQTVTSDRVANFETLISVLKDASPPFETLIGVLKDAGINLESLQGIAADAGVNFEAEGVATAIQGVNFESLLSVVKLAAPNFESLLGVLKDAGVNVLAEGFVTSDKGINYEALISVQETTGVNFESLITASQQVSSNFESLITASRDLGLNFESLGTVFQDAVAVYEALVGLKNDIDANIESLIGVRQDEAANIEVLGRVIQDAVANLESLGTATQFVIVNISTFLVIAAKLLLDCPLSDVLELTCELEDTLDLECLLTEDEC